MKEYGDEKKNPPEEKHTEEIIPLQGEVVNVRQSPFGGQGDLSTEGHQPTKKKKSFQLRWQTGCLGCVVPFTILFLLFFYLFRLGISSFGG
jgi:hypothetical protein